MALTWYGDQIVQRARIATGRGMVAAGEMAANEMEADAHRVTGQLARSMNATQATDVGGDHVVVEAGSELRYADPERRRGGEHDFAASAHEQAKVNFPNKLRQAFRAEGFKV